MSNDVTDETNTIHDLTEKGREKLDRAQARAKDGLAQAAEYIRANPWIAVAGAAIIGGVITALSKPAKPRQRKIDAVREWLDEAYTNLPTQKQFRSMAKSAGVPASLKELKKKLNLA